MEDQPASQKPAIASPAINRRSFFGVLLGIGTAGMGRFSPSQSFVTRFILFTQSPVRVAGLMRAPPMSSPVQRFLHARLSNLSSGMAGVRWFRRSQCM